MLRKIFGTEKPIIGMLHLKKIFNDRNSEEYRATIKKAQQDIQTLQEGGIDGICIENWEVESIGPFLELNEAKNLEKTIETIRGNIVVPAGINVLHNDYRIAFSFASKFNLKFVWLDVFVDMVRTDFEHSEVFPFDIVVDTEDVRKHKKLSGNIPLFVQVHPKHYKPIDEYGNEISEDKRPPIEFQARKAANNGADAIVITKSTGIAPKFSLLKKVKDSVGDFPVLQGSGTTFENIKSVLSVVDGVIVGTGVKTKDFDRVVVSKVRKLVKAAALKEA